MKHIKKYSIFENSLKKKGIESDGIGLVLSFKYSDTSGRRFICFYMSSATNFIKCVRGLVYSMIKDTEYQLKEEKIENKKDVINLFRNDPEFKIALGNNIKNFNKIEDDSIKIYELTPRPYESNSINKLGLEEIIRDSKDYDPNNMRDSDDEDSMPYPGWETDRIISNLYKMYNPNRDLFKKIASDNL